MLAQGAEPPRHGAYLGYVSTEAGESNEEIAQKSKQKFCAAILVLAQGAEPPRHGAYLGYVSTEAGESNEEIAQKSKQKAV